MRFAKRFAGAASTFAEAFHPARLPGLGRTLAVAVAGGGVAALLGVPAGWMSGSAIAAASFAMWKRNLTFPDPLLPVIYIVLGAAMGSTVSSDTLAGFDNLPVSAVGIFMAIVGVTAASFLILRHLARWDPVTAYYSAVPGALAYSVALASEHPTADIPRVALSQTMRLLMMVALVPMLIAISSGGVALVPRVVPPTTVVDVCILLLACTVGPSIARLLRVPAPFLTGPFFVSVGLHLSGLSTASIPQALSIPAYVLMGANIGVRFGKTDFATVAKAILPLLCAFCVALAISLLIAIVVTLVSDVTLLQSFMAFAPGGIDSMGILALAMHMDAAYVIVHQIARFILLNFMLPIGAAVFLRNRSAGGPE